VHSSPEAIVFQQLLTFLKGSESAGTPKYDLQMAVAILLLEAAHRDDRFDPEEHAVIERLLTERFALSQQECRELMAACEVKQAGMVQLYPCTRAIVEHMSAAERVDMIEMLWEVAYADGVLDPDEDALIRRLGALIYVEDRDRVLARQRVLARKSAGHPTE
jgi:uncharacterized tellurite resistance protein B-like protein